MAKDIRDLLQWCWELDIQRVTLYDEQGLLRRHSRLLASSLTTSFPFCLVSSQTDGFIRAPYFDLSLKDPQYESKRSIRLTLISESDGKDLLAKVASSMGEAARKRLLEARDVSIDLVQEKLYSSLVPDVNLLIVLGGRHLRLKGFPPWQLRLAEIYHEPSLNLIGPARMSYRTFSRALDAYESAEMRGGK